MRQRIYVAGPISRGDLAHNIQQAREAGDRLLKAGFAPFVPHLSVFWSGNTPEVLPAGTTAEDWYAVDLPWVAASDAVLRLPGESVGADKEVALAIELGIPVYYNLDALLAHPPGPQISSVGPDVPVVVNEAGGKQSRVPYRCDLLPAKATLEVAAVLHAGAEKYGPDNWRQIPTRDHINHALTHLFAFLAGDCSDAHLSHAACRALMALEMDRT